jgi:hypothetical protein
MNWRVYLQIQREQRLAKLCDALCDWDLITVVQVVKFLILCLLDVLDLIFHYKLSV